MSDHHQEMILGIPTARLRAAGLFQGFRPFDKDLFDYMLDRDHLEYRPRGPAEQDPEFKQLIPYVVLRCRDQVFHYRRGGSTNEARLRSLRSVGIGGHISQAHDADSADPYRAGMERELHEEVDVRSNYSETMFGLINDDSTPVGAVHLGVVHLLHLDKPMAMPREAGLADAGFAPFAELQTQLGEFETWSQLVLRQLA
jgi:predicted NUDIX family phosphoesterase